MRRGPKFWATLVAVALVAVLAAVDQTVVATALPHMIADLQGAAILGWVFTAYFLSATATVAVAGKLADLFGRRGVFMMSIAIFLAGLAVVRPGHEHAAAGGVQRRPGNRRGQHQHHGFVVMGDLFSARERGKWQAVNNIGFATASAIGPSIGGVLSDNCLVALDLPDQRAAVSGDAAPWCTMGCASQAATAVRDQRSTGRARCGASSAWWPSCWR